MLGVENIQLEGGDDYTATSTSLLVRVPNWLALESSQMIVIGPTCTMTCHNCVMDETTDTSAHGGQCKVSVQPTPRDVRHNEIETKAMMAHIQHAGWQ